MRAVVQTEYGGPQRLAVTNEPVPAIEADEVLVEVVAAGIDRGTWHLMTGLPRLVRLAFGLRGPRQPIPGLDVAGRVADIGTEVTRFAVGDRVFGIAGGSLAEYAVAKEKKLSHCPPDVSLRHAGVATVSGTTALQALIDVGDVIEGQHVLVMGAAGGVGSFAVQIAKAHCAVVTGVASGHKLPLVGLLGADHKIDYTATDPLNGDALYDLIIDTGSQCPLKNMRQAMQSDGTLVIVGGAGGGEWTGGFGRILRAPLVSLFTKQRLTSVISKEHHDYSDRLAALMANRGVRSAISRGYELDEIRNALTDLEDGQIAGKALINIGTLVNEHD